MNYWLLFVPLASALLGWLGAWTAGKVFIYKILPGRRQYIAEGIAKSVTAAFSFAGIEKKITDPEAVKKVMPVVEEHVDDFLRNKLKNKMPVIGMLIGDKTINTLKEVFLAEIEELFPHVLKSFADNLQGEMNIETEVSKRINAISPAQTEKMFLPVLQYFSFAGIFSGLVIGLINIVLFFMIK